MTLQVNLFAAPADALLVFLCNCIISYFVVFFLHRNVPLQSIPDPLFKSVQIKPTAVQSHIACPPADQLFGSTCILALAMAIFSGLNLKPTTFPWHTS